MMRQIVLLVTALATILTGGALSAASAASATPVPGEGAGQEAAQGAGRGVEREAGWTAALDAGRSAGSEGPRQADERLDAAFHGTGEDAWKDVFPEASSGPSSEASPLAPLSSPLVDGDPRDLGAKVFQGQMFDTCTAPTTTTMRAWRQSSPYKAVGIYFGGRGRGCAQPQLSPDWVRTTSGMGWELIPIYVGSQSPCVHADHKKKYRMSAQQPAQQGAREGQDAVNQARHYGMQQRSALYLDMEAYDQDNASCAGTTLDFIKGWNRAVRAAGYLPGFYSSASSGITHLERARINGHKDLPDVMWYARWNVPASVTKEPSLADAAWKPHRRIHQYVGNVRQTYGGHSINIDRNLVDAPVAILK